MKNKFVFTTLIVLSAFKMYASGGAAINVYNNCFYTIDFVVFGKEEFEPTTCGYPTNVFTLAPNYYMIFSDISDVCSIGIGWQTGYDCVHPPSGTNCDWTMAVVRRNGPYALASVGNSSCVGSTSAIVPGCSPTTTVTWSYNSSTNTYRVQVDN